MNDYGCTDQNILACVPGGGWWVLRLYTLWRRRITLTGCGSGSTNIVIITIKSVIDARWHCLYRHLLDGTVSSLVIISWILCKKRIIKIISALCWLRWIAVSKAGWEAHSVMSYVHPWFKTHQNLCQKPSMKINDFFFYFIFLCR